MGYRGQTFPVLCDRGGFSYSRNTDLLAPNTFVTPSRNINLHEGGRRKRGGTSKVNSTAVSGAPRVMGGFDFQLSTQSFQVFLGTDGKLYKNSTSTIKTGMSTVNKPSFDVFGGELFVCDGVTTPQTWDGVAAGTSNLTTPAADWSGTNQPVQCLAHGREASRRMWYLLGNAIYYSSLSNGKEVSGGTSGKITIDTGDAFGLVGMIEWQNRIIAFSKKKAFIINDDDTDRANWGYSQAAWSGGAAHWRLMCKTLNDLIVMTEDGDIYSVASVQAYGDYKKASLAKPAFVDSYIRDNIRLSFFDDFHMTYDPTLRAISTWVVRNGLTTVDTALVYFVDRPPEEAWTIHDGQDNAASGYRASCSFAVRSSAGTYVTYTGDYVGFIWKLNQATRSDDSHGYYGGFRMPNFSFENPRLNKQFKRGRVILTSQGNFNLQAKIWVDGQVKNGATIPMGSSGATLGSFTLDVDILGSVEFLDQEFDLNYYGKRLQLEFYNSGAGQDFFVSQVLIDYKMMGALP